MDLTADADTLVVDYSAGIVLLSPAVVLGVVAVLRGGAALEAAATPVGLLLGGALLVGGVRLGGHVYDPRPARLLAKVVFQD